MLWFLALLAAVSGVLALPVEIRFSATLDAPGETLRRHADVRWVFGLVQFTLAGGTGTGREVRRRGHKPRARRSSHLNFRRLLFNVDFWARLGSLVRRLLGAAHWHLLRLQARFGLDDPADTGRFYSLLGAVLAPVAASHPQVSIDPVFGGPDLSFQCEGAVRFIPLEVAWVLLSFAAAPSTWRAIRPAWRA